MFYFPLTETVRNSSSIGKSLTAAWAVFATHFVSLAIVGSTLLIELRAIIILVSLAALLVENHFDVAALGMLDYVSPLLSFPKNNFYNLITAIPQAIWQTYSASVFTFAYLKYSGAKMGKHKTP